MGPGAEGLECGLGPEESRCRAGGPLGVANDEVRGAEIAEEILPQAAVRSGASTRCSLPAAALAESQDPECLRVLHPDLPTATWNHTDRHLHRYLGGSRIGIGQVALASLPRLRQS